MKHFSLLNMPTKPKSRFLPNFEQIKEAMGKLPDASDPTECEYFDALITVEDKVHEITFVKMKIQKGSTLVRRWVYEGKFLIREQDIINIET